MKDHFFFVFELYYWTDSQEEYKICLEKLILHCFKISLNRKSQTIWKF